MDLASIIRDEHFLCKDEVYADFFKCPKCGSDYIMRDFSYCPDCGVAITFELSEDAE